MGLGLFAGLVCDRLKAPPSQALGCGTGHRHHALRQRDAALHDRRNHAALTGAAAQSLLACALRFVAEAHPGLIAMADRPHLAAHAAACEALPVFQEIRQPFAAPA
jgi:hypothetical protein